MNLSVVASWTPCEDMDMAAHASASTMRTINAAVRPGVFSWVGVAPMPKMTNMNTAAKPTKTSFKTPRIAISVEVQFVGHVAHGLAFIELMAVDI